MPECSHNQDLGIYVGAMEHFRLSDVFFINEIESRREFQQLTDGICGLGYCLFIELEPDRAINGLKVQN